MKQINHWNWYSLPTKVPKMTFSKYVAGGGITPPAPITGSAIKAPIW